MFSYDPATNPEAGEIIEFTNESLDANDFLWDFGNEQTSDEEMATTRFKPPGNYTVTLTASNAFRSSTYSENILIHPPTILEFWVYDPDGNPLDYGNVEIFATYNDASLRQNILYLATTDLNGYVKFNNLEAQSYYVVFIKATASGTYFSGGNVGPLLQNQINEYWGIAELYTESARKSALSNDNIPKKQD